MRARTFTCLRGRLMQAKEDDDSDVEYEAGSEGGMGDRSQAPTPSQSAAPKKLGKRNLQKGDVQGDDVGGPDDNYDHDDPFIDDGEMIDLYEADLKRPKHGGFFINKVLAATRPAARTRGASHAACSRSRAHACGCGFAGKH